MSKSKKVITRRRKRRCSVCGKQIDVIFYEDFSYWGGHYFGKIPLHRKKEIDKAIRAGIRKVKMGKMVIDVLKKDPKPYAFFEYWECPQCYKG